MAQTRKLVRDAMKTILAAPSTGFNARLASLAAAYRITAFTIDWAAGSQSIFQGYLQGRDVDLSQITQDDWTPIGILLYTTALRNDGEIKPTFFSGTIQGVVDCYLKFRTGIETDDIESICDAIEDAVLTCLYDDAAAWPVHVTPSQFYEVPKEPAMLLEDGWQQRIPILIPFKVTV